MRTLMDPAVFPPALRGIMLAAFAAAYMSTIGTQLNWGASYMVNDFYRRFLRRRERRARVRDRLADRDRRADAGVDLRHAPPRVDRAGVEAADRDRRRHRHGAAAALVLVANQRVVGSVGDGGGGRGVAVPADRAEVGRRQAARLRLPDARHRGTDDDRVAGGDVSDARRSRTRRCRRSIAACVRTAAAGRRSPRPSACPRRRARSAPSCSTRSSAACWSTRRCSALARCCCAAPRSASDCWSCPRSPPPRLRAISLHRKFAEPRSASGSPSAS